jgi:hypothetical protein
LTLVVVHGVAAVVVGAMVVMGNAVLVETGKDEEFDLVSVADSTKVVLPVADVEVVEVEVVEVEVVVVSLIRYKLRSTSSTIIPIINNAKNPNMAYRKVSDLTLSL